MSLIDLIKDNIPQIVEFVDKAESLFLYFVCFVSLAVLIVFHWLYIWRNKIR
jgi:hypothetical protein